MSLFAAIEAEFDEWFRRGLAPCFWLRDDDAMQPSRALDRLIEMVRRYDVPLLLAVIPVDATAALAEQIVDEPRVTPCVHGYAHRRHTPDGTPPLELGGDRPADEILLELARGRERLTGLFGDRLSRILVPPWNRLSNEVASRLHEVGFTALSTNSWHDDGSTLPQLNTQIDIIDWGRDRQGHTIEWAAGELLRRLRQARERGGFPLGILSHHLIHDAQAWDTLKWLLHYLRTERGFAFEAADDLVDRMLTQRSRPLEE